MYGFHKITNVENNAFSKTQEFGHRKHHFIRDRPDLLHLVTRKKSGETGDPENPDYLTIMNEIQAIKKHQMTISEDLKRIQADNLALWQEQIDTRSRHTKHQETIDKILAFLGSVYGIQRQDEKSIRPKKRKLLLQHDQDDPFESLESVFGNDRTKETFDEMFRSASTSPVLRPLRQPMTTTASDRIDSVGQVENRFTMPNYDTRREDPVMSHAPQIQHITHGNSSDDLLLQSTAFPETRPSLSPWSPTSSLHDSGDAFQQALTTVPSSLTGPENMQLTPSIQSRILGNTHRANELRQGLAVQDQNIAGLALLLDMDPKDLELSPEDFNNYLNTHDPTPPSLDPEFESLHALSAGPGLDDGTPQHDMHPPATDPQEPGSANSSSYGSAGTPGAKIQTAEPTPSPASAASSIHEELVEEVDMDMAKGRKRQKNE